MNAISAPSRRFMMPLLLTFVAIYIFFFLLGGRGFENKDTIWYVEIAWEMLKGGDWIIPKFNTVIFTEKPIFFIWCVAGFSKIMGAITPFTSRFPSALAALGTVFLTVFIGKKIFSRRAGLLSGFILATSYAFAWEARACMVDMVFTFWVTLTLILLYQGLTKGEEVGSFFLLSYVAAGLAAITKGPLGLALPAVVFLIFMIFTRSLRLLRRMHIAWGIIIVVAIQAAWYVPFLIRVGPDGRRFFFDMYIYKENFLRLTTGFDKTEPFWFYIPSFFAHFLPWSPFLLLSPFMARGAGEEKRSILFPAVWSGGIFAFLSLSSGKHSRYLLPLYPAAALMAGEFWDRIFDNASWRRCFICIVVIFVIGWSIFIAAFLPRDEIKRSKQQRLAAELAPTIKGTPLATYGLFSRRLALGFFLGTPVTYIDREESLMDYMRRPGNKLCLMEVATFDTIRASLPLSAQPVMKCRYRDNELVLVGM